HPDDSYYTDEVQNGFAKNFCFRNNDLTVQDTDYYKMAMRDLRALQYAKSLPEWNGTALETKGGSMGGWRAITLAALDCDVKQCTASIPWSVDLAGHVKYGYMKGWRPDWTANLDYVDLKNLATLVKCPVTFTAGLGDYVCPPSGEIQLYRALPEPKKVTFTQNMGHGSVHGPNAASYVLQAPVPPPPPRTLNWSWVSGNSKLWSNPANWKDAVGNTNAVPRSGDKLYLTREGYPSKNDIPGLELQYLKLASGFQSQDSSSQALIFRQGSDGIYNQGFMFFDIPILLEGTNVPFYSSTTFVPRKSWKSFDGNPCGVVKTGPGSGGLGEGTDFAGFKYVEVRDNGTWVYGVNGCTGPQHLEPGQVFTFAEANTKMRVGTQCAFTNFWLRETGSAVGGTHSIGTQYDNQQWYRGKLAICGTPPDDETVFTGTFIETVDFRWDPASSAKSFVLSGQTSTTTGNVEVANGTMRLTAGATYSQLGTLKLSGGANTCFAVDTPPAAAFHGASLELVSGNEKLSLASGVTLTFARLTVGGVRKNGGTYTSANATWIIGAGTVVVEGIGGDRLNWVDGSAPGNRNWSNPKRWINQRTGANDTPKSGDILYQTSDGNSSKYNDIDGLELRQLLYGGGYSNPNGKAVTLRADSLGINSSGFMHNDLPLKIEGTAMPVVVNQSCFMSIRMGFRSYDGRPCGVVKTGAGVLAIIPLDSSVWTNFRYVQLKEGIFALGAQGSGNMSRMDPGLEVTFAGNASLTIEKDLAMSGLCIFETGAAVNGAHRLTGRNDNGYRVGTLTVTGLPRVDSQTFTGTIEGGVGFIWSPSEARKTFVFSGTSSKSTTTNQLSVTRGTVRLANGATFTALHALNLSGGAETQFEVTGVPATAFHAANLVLATGEETLKLVAGVKLAVDTLSVNGVVLPAGVYRSATGLGTATAVSWITGGGYVCVGGADIDLPAAAAGSATGTLTANGGSDTSVGNAANWGEAGNTVLPDLAGGTLDATFSAGSAAALDRAANLHGVSLAAPGAFAFTSSGDFFATLGAGGLATSGDGRTYALGWSLFLNADQTWQVAAGDTLNVGGTVAGAGALSIKGGGTVNFDVSNEMGPVTISNVVVNVNADNAFGSIGDPVSINFNASKLTLNGVTLARGFTDTAEKEKTGNIYVAANTDNVIEGDVSFPTAATVVWNLGANSSLRFKGSIRRQTTNWCYFRGDAATLYFDAPLVINPIGSAFGIGENKTLYFNAPSNEFGNVWFWIMGNNNRIYTTVPYAITTSSGNIRDNNRYSGNVWDMCGCDQGAKNLGFPNGGFTVTSASPATLHHVGNPRTADVSDITNKVVFAGAVNLSYDGTRYHMCNAASTSTGMVQVTNGTLAFGPAGSWTNAAKAVVTGGKLKLENKTVFGKETDMELAASGATVALDYDGTMKMRQLTLGSEPREAGIYGAADNTSVAPNHRLACFTGTGKILFLGNDRSTLLIFR
ncbi:MAG: acetylxylan esterase, partial [Kiritimatiellae bacterium]|nr:acetylxylan esterase [Kiritimatiellia bacterium]